MAAPPTSTLLERRQSYDVVPRFYFARAEANDDAVASRAHSICRRRVLTQIDALLLTPSELEGLVNRIMAFARAPPISAFQRALLKKLSTPSGIAAIDSLQDDNMVLRLSYADYSAVARRCESEKVRKLLSAKTFLMMTDLLRSQKLPQDDDGTINGATLLEYVVLMQRDLAATRYLSQLDGLAIDGAIPVDGVTRAIKELITKAVDGHLNIESDFLPYFERIATRLIVLRHDTTPGRGGIAVDALLQDPVFLEFYQLVNGPVFDLFVTSSNRFHPDTIRQIHRQFVQLDRDKNGLLSHSEMLEYGKKKAFNPVHQTPTHDLTPLFVDRVFALHDNALVDGEMDYKTYIDFTLLMADSTSENALKFFWSILDTQHQGYLDAFVLDPFLHALISKISDHEPDEAITVERIRTQVFDLVSPTNPLRITWKDLVNCKLGHLVVRMLVDFVAYRDYEACDGRFVLPLGTQ
ncbi:hypothetical protein P43SY_004169 [Pythium insidiosum]|uniref:EF-hand domain-containing protein n=1 Tax=Pythium insidiosum TaxID=114742 RepID=A0AAD5LTV8_PYTIN|nr:hypothetical protein P43SY_004169 [Pythium insidiosum]